MALQSYIFDASKGETPESLAQRRQLADTIASRIFGSAPKNVGEGLNALGQAFIARSMRDETDAAQKAGMASIPPWLGGTGSPAAGIASSIMGQPAQPITSGVAAPAGNTTIPVAPPQADTTGKIYSNNEPSPLDPPSGTDREAMIQTILGEAGNEPQLGKNAVASVIRTRAVDGGYGGDTPLGVVQAPNQFEPWNTSQGRARMAAAASDPKQRAAADAAIASAYGEGGRAPEDPTEGMTHFYSPAGQAAMGRQPPKWAGGESVTIGGHVFNSPDDAPGAAPVQMASNAAVPIPNATGAPHAAPIPNATGTPQAALLAGAPNDPAALPPNAQPAQGALPTAQAVQTASQPTAPRSQNYGGPFPNVSTADLTKAAFNPWVKASSPVAAQALTAEIARRAQMDQQASDPLRSLQIKKAQQDLEKPDETFGVIGQDPNTGKSQYGFINTKTGTARPYNIPQTGNAPQGSIQEAMKAGVKGDDLYQFLPPDRANTVKAMIEGRMPPPSTTAMRSPATMQLIDAANAIDPSFDATTWKARSTFNTQFGSQAPSSIGGQKVLMSTALGHLSEVAKSAAELGNTDGFGLAPVGHVLNAAKNQTTQQAAIANAMNDKVAKFSGEVGKLYSGSQGGGVHEREDTRQRLGSSLTAAELAAGLEASKDLILSKQKALEDQTSQIFGPDRAKQFDFVGPEGREAIDKIDSAIMKLRGQNPDQKASGSVAPTQSASPTVVKEGATIMNPQTGERRIMQGGKWVPVT